MGWFNDQILERRKNDNEALENAFVDVVSAVLGDRAATAARDERFIIKSAIDEVLKYYHIPSADVPEDIRDRDGQLEYLLRPWGVMRRRDTAAASGRRLTPAAFNSKHKNKE